MGCDGYLKNLGEPKEIDFTCYECSKPVDPDDPINGHEKCVDERNGETLASTASTKIGEVMSSKKDREAVGVEPLVRQTKSIRIGAVETLEFKARAIESIKLAKDWLGFMEKQIRPDEYGAINAMLVEELQKRVEQAKVFQDDVRDLLEALGLGTHARPESPHDVVQNEVIPAIKALRSDGKGDGPPSPVAGS